jgi:hypothetical protein
MKTYEFHLPIPSLTGQELETVEKSVADNKITITKLSLPS